MMGTLNNTIFGSILGKEIVNFKNETKTLRGYCRAYRLKPNLKAYVKYATQRQSQPIAYTYQWYRNGKPIKGATSSSYTLTDADRNAKVKCISTPIKNPLISMELNPPSWYDNLIKKYEHLDKQVENDIIENYLLFKSKSPN